MGSLDIFLSGGTAALLHDLIMDLCKVSRFGFTYGEIQ